MKNYRNADDFLTEEWTGKKSSRLYKLAIMNLDLVEAYYHLDIDKFNGLFQNAAPAFKKHKLFVAEQMFLEQKYEQTAAFLGTYEAKNPYNEVQRQYICWGNVLIKPEISKWQKNVCVMYLHMEIQCPVKRKRRNGS